METIWKGKQTNKQTSRGGMCRGVDAGGGAGLHSMWSPVCNASEYMEELWRCIRDALEKCRVRYAGSYSDKGLSIRKISCFQCWQRWQGKRHIQIWLNSHPTHATASWAVCEID